MKSLFLLLILLITYSVTFAQENYNSRKNLIFVEGGGAVAAGVGLGYERYLAQKELSRFTARAGAGLIENFSSPTFFAGSSFLFGRKWQAELGLNYITRIDLSTFRSVDAEDEKTTGGVQTLIGLRYQNWSNGISFRIFYVPPLGPFASWLPYGGLSVGYAF